MKKGIICFVGILAFISIAYCFAAQHSIPSANFQPVNWYLSDSHPTYVYSFTLEGEHGANVQIYNAADHNGVNSVNVTYPDPKTQAAKMIKIDPYNTASFYVSGQGNIIIEPVNKDAYSQGTLEFDQ